MTENKRLTFFDVEVNDDRSEFYVTNGNYGVKLLDENGAYMVCQMINRIIQDFELVGIKND